MPNTIEDIIIHSVEPLAAPADAKEINVLGERGLWLNEQDELNANINLNEYKINQDAHPEYKVKTVSKPLKFLRNVLIRRLKPPKPPQHGVLNIVQEADIVKPAAPPIIIRQPGNKAAQAETIVIRERPPKMPEALPEQTIRIKGKVIEPPARRVIIEKLPDEPSKPDNIIIEKWLPYDTQTRKVVFHKASSDFLNQEPVNNLIIEWKHTNPIVENEIKVETIDADPSKFVATYGNAFKENVDIHEYDKNFHEYASHYKTTNGRYDLEGDVQAIKLLDAQTLDQLGLAGHSTPFVSNITNNTLVDIYKNSEQPIKQNSRKSSAHADNFDVGQFQGQSIVDIYINTKTTTTTTTKSSSRKSSSSSSAVTLQTVELRKDANSGEYGLVVIGGYDLNMSLYVLKLVEAGSAESDGRLVAGDEILQVNGVNTQGLCSRDVAQAFKSSDTVVLQVRKTGLPPPSVSEVLESIKNGHRY